MKRGQARGIIIKKEKIWILAHADDIVLLAKNSKELKEMMKRLKKYLREKKVVFRLDVEKSKKLSYLRKIEERGRKKNGSGEAKR